MRLDNLKDINLGNMADIVLEITNITKPYSYLGLESRQQELLAIFSMVTRGAIDARQALNDKDEPLALALSEGVLTLIHITYVLGRLDERTAQTEALIKERSNR